jgi:hypothetical protein
MNRQGAKDAKGMVIREFPLQKSYGGKAGLRSTGAT